MPNPDIAEGRDLKQPLRVLILEDEPLDAELTVAALRQSGLNLTYDVVDTPELLKRRLAADTFEVILTDFNLQGWTGLDALDIVKASGRDVPVILVTGTLGDEAAVAAIKKGASDYVLKDRLARLPSVVQRALGDKALRARSARAESELRESEERYRLLFERNVAGIGQITLDGRIIDCNESYARIFGYDSCEDIKKQRTDALWFDPAERGQLVAHLKQDLALQNVEIQHRRKDGHAVWTLENLTLAEQGEGKESVIHGTVVDITERKKADRALIASTTQYRRLFEAAKDGILILDASTGAITDANPFIADLLGYSRDELIGKALWEIGAFKSIAATNLAFRKLQGEEYIRYDNLPLETNDGKRVEVEFVSNAYMVNEKKVIQCNIHDISQRKRTEALLVNLRKAVDNSGEVIFMTDRAGIFTFINTEFTRLYGHTAEEVLGKVTPRILKSRKQSEDDYAVFWQDILSGKVVKGDFKNAAKDGRLIEVDVSASAIFDDAGNITGFIAIQRDVTEHNRLEAQFLQAQKMEAIGRLAGGIAHDFNNLLTIITGYGQLVIERLEVENPLRCQVEEIIKAGDRAASLTQQLLAFSRKQTLVARVISLDAIIESLHPMLQRIIGEDIDLRVVRNKGLGAIKADTGQIDQVIMNLALNARDAMPHGGKLSIETCNVELDETYAQSHATVEPGWYVMLAVSDTGTGMDAETQSHIFEPFFTTKEQGKGTGLGLSTVYGIVKQSGGYIWVYSELEHGTSFKIYFPRVDKEDTSHPGPAFVKSAQGSETVLLVEDEDSLRSLARRVLEGKGYLVLDARDGAEAIEIAKSYKGQIHLLVTDVIMPKMGGQEIAGKLSAVRPGIRILFMSGYTEGLAVRDGGHDLTSQFFLQKPFSPEGLSRKVREVLDSKD